MPTTFAPSALALDILLQLNQTFLKNLPSYLGIKDKLMTLIEATQGALNVAVSPTCELLIKTLLNNISSVFLYRPDERT
jgi:hypothetical protein